MGLATKSPFVCKNKIKNQSSVTEVLKIRVERLEYLHFANERYATSSGFGFSMYNHFKQSIIDVTALGGS